MSPMAPPARFSVTPRPQSSIPVNARHGRQPFHPFIQLVPTGSNSIASRSAAWYSSSREIARGNRWEEADYG